MKFLIAQILLWTWQAAVCQTHIGMHGSFFIAAIGSDGIMVATDSRVSFFDWRDPKREILGYFDDMQKTVPIGKYVFASNGQGLVGSKLVPSVLSDFFLKVKPLPQLNLLLFVVTKFIKDNTDQRSYQIFASNILIAAGYEDGMPAIYALKPIENRFDSVVQFGCFEADNTVFDQRNSWRLPCKQLGQMAETAILQYAKDKKNKYIGGPIRTIQITPDRTIWLKNAPKSFWKTDKDFLLDYKAGKVKITFTSPQNKERWQKLMALDHPDLFK